MGGSIRPSGNAIRGNGEELCSEKCQSANSVLIQKSETAFERIPVDFAHRIDLGYQCAFAMRHHRQISKKPSRNDILAKPKIMLSRYCKGVYTTHVREFSIIRPSSLLLPTLSFNSRKQLEIMILISQTLPNRQRIATRLCLGESAAL